MKITTQIISEKEPLKLYSDLMIPDIVEKYFGYSSPNNQDFEWDSRLARKQGSSKYDRKQIT